MAATINSMSGRWPGDDSASTSISLPESRRCISSKYCALALSPSATLSLIARRDWWR